MDKNFYVSLYRKSVTDDYRRIRIALPAQPYTLLDALERLGADENEKIGVDVTDCAAFRYLPSLLDLLGSTRATVMWRGCSPHRIDHHGASSLPLLTACAGSVAGFRARRGDAEKTRLPTSEASVTAPKPAQRLGAERRSPLSVDLTWRTDLSDDLTGVLLSRPPSRHF